MPKFPDDMDKARALHAKQLAARPPQIIKGVPLPDEIPEATKLRKELAAELGIDPSQVVIHVCKRGRR